MTVTDLTGVTAWPTRERFAAARQALNAALYELEQLEHEYLALNDDTDRDPRELARGSVPVPAEAIAATVEFLMETEYRASDIAQLHQRIGKWPGILAHVRVEQRLGD